MASDSDEEETFVTYGTPVEILDKDAPRKKPTLVEDQVVTDKQGRQRFHGAFSGGFSAGYYNTVGSEKGWAPSTFVSSRSQKTGKTQQRPEDFMDEDDFGEFGIAPRKITTTDTYEQLTESEVKKKRGWRDVDGGVIPGQAPLQDLIQPNRESVGIQLLRKMGWRHGQGIGPRQKKKQGAICIFLQAFGVGAFEDQDDDIYTVDHMSNYDQFIGDEISSSVGSKTSNSKTKFFNASYVSKILKGFTLSENPRPPNKVYPPPDVPRDYKPYHKMKDVQPAGPKFKSKLFTMGAIQRGALLGEEQLPAPEVQPVDKKPAVNSTKPAVHPSQASKQTSDPSELLKPTSADNKPVDIAAVVASLVSAQRAKMESRFAKPPQPVNTESPSVSIASAGSSTFGFKPFAKDPAKQQRYEKFLASKGKGGDSLSTGEADTITEWERRREHDEFTRASILYRPLSSTMASRFTPAKYTDDDSKDDVPVDQESEKGHHAKAAEMKMFGRLTRDTFEWHPDRLLCKRFNIPDPYPGSSIVGLPTVKKDKISLYNFMSVPSHEESHISEKHQPKQPSPEPQTTPERKTLPIFKSGGIFSNFTPVQKATVTEVQESKPEDEEPVEEKRPPMDLFKAIFQDESSEDSEESSEDEDEQMEDRDENETNKKEEKEGTQDQVKKGSEEINEIFPAAAGDEHLTIPQSSLSMKEHSEAPELVKKTVNEDVYGPPLPPPSNENNPSFSSSLNPTKDIVDPHKHKHLYVSKDERYSKRNKDKNYRKEKSSEETSKRHSSHEHLEKKQKHKHRKKKKHRGKHKKEKKSKKSKHSSKYKHDARKRRRSDSERETSTDSYSSDN
ncbi:G patch domain-containing protein 1-like [Anneissia japonica]|uniref:G patch domain-containing protein 1-like n=1 Tax=Anneissia japonica TaxID=1529436 RepID=UPI0014255037|nr:G patch domain-containing protein 1-like [Anneissia japonica]